MMMTACQCDGLPPHDHFMGHRQNASGVWGPYWDTTDVGRVWVDWKEIARELMAHS